jgi:hypothetical protein
MVSSSRRRLTWFVYAVALTAVVTQFGQNPGAQQEQGLFVSNGMDDQPFERPLAVMRSRSVDINFARLPQAASADAPAVLTLNPFEDVFLKAAIDQVEANGLESVTYSGHVAGDDGSTVTLVVAGGVMVGTIVTSDAAYQVRFNGESHVIRQVDPGAYPPELHDELTIDRPYVADPGRPDSPMDSGVRVDVMVLYTATARAAAGGTAAIQNLITLGVTETNQMYANSGIGTRMRLVRMAEVAYTESGDALTDRNRLFNGADGQLDFVHTWRNTYGADMVQMLVNNAGSGCGIAYLNGPAASMAGQSAYAYAVTDWQCVSPNYTFAHEFGHIQGANHAPDDPTGTGAYSYSFGFKRCGSTPYFRSVMAYACTSGATGTVRSKYFSNPGVNFSGAPTGTATQNNGATLHNTRSTVANFRQEVFLTRVTSLWPPADEADLTVGKVTRLWAYVVNDGPYALPASARVWFLTDGPGTGSGEGWVGSAAVTGLAPAAGAWYYFDFTIPSTAVPGAWNYRAAVWDSAAGEYLSAFAGPQAFTVYSVQGSVLSLWPVPVTQAGHTATLWARAQNTGTARFPAGTVARYWVSGPGFSNYVGSVSVAGLASGATAWYAFNWAIPPARTAGAHNYWAILEYTSAGVTRNISAWQGPQAFTVTAAPAYSGIIDQLWTVTKPNGTAPQRGFPVRLWALARNNGLNAHDANTYTYFWVAGPSFNGYVGSQTNNGLASGASVWRYTDWTIPAAATLGSYSYRAIIWRWSGSAWQQLSGWSATQGFSVASDEGLDAAADGAPVPAFPDLPPPPPPPPGRRQ